MACRVSDVAAADPMLHVQVAAEAVVKAALDKGSGDNLTAQVVRFGWHGR